MRPAEKHISDYITGRRVPDRGAEANRQAVERFLVEARGFDKTDIAVNVALRLQIAGRPYGAYVDLVVHIGGRRIMAVKCAAGSLGSREREIVSAARLLDAYILPFAMVSDGKTAILLDSLSGRPVAQGLAGIPSKARFQAMLKDLRFEPLAEERRQKEKLIFRSYDSMNVNVARPIL